MTKMRDGARTKKNRKRVKILGFSTVTPYLLGNGIDKLVIHESDCLCVSLVTSCSPCVLSERNDISLTRS
jgi:hypothetical protein